MSETVGWKVLLAGYGEDRPKTFPLPAYSEFMPPPRLGRKPYGEPDPDLFTQDDPWGWRVSEAEQEWELAPGLDNIAREVYASLLNLGQGREEHLIRGHLGRNLDGNQYWPPELAARAGALAHERFVGLLPLALSRTQDDKGRVRWTLLGSSELGPERAFWRGFADAPGRERGDDAIGFLCGLLQEAFGENASDVAGLQALGFRVMPSDGTHPWAEWDVELPAWARPFATENAGRFDQVRYLLTFRPFETLPEGVRARYLDGRLHLLPFPGSLVFWGMPTYLRLAGEVRNALQIPLLRVTRRHNGPGIRIPQSGWVHEAGPENLTHDFPEALMRETFTRTHRWDRVHRHEDELAVFARADPVVRVLFSTALDAMGLYDKPMARNAQVWTRDFRLVLDGPNATPEEIERAKRTVVAGGTFGYRFLYPPMRVGGHEVVWHRPLAAFVRPGDESPTVLHDDPLGILVASFRDRGTERSMVELWPRPLRRLPECAAVTVIRHASPHTGVHDAANVLALRSAWRALGERPLPRTFARRLLRLAKGDTVEEWLDQLPGRARSAELGRQLCEELEGLLGPASEPERGGAEVSLTYARTAMRAFEEAYWHDIAALAHGHYLTKDNADCVLDPVTEAHAPHQSRDLGALGDYLIGRHRAAIFEGGMAGKAWCGELPFEWRTDFPFEKFGGWVANQEGCDHERDILVVIPGRDRRQAVVLADHYDTAYMEDVYDTSKGGSGARLAARGADDNHSATATLLQAAPIYLELAKQGRLERDVWLLHLTGEEFPADCMGARAFCRALIEGTLAVTVDNSAAIDLSATRVTGLVVMDMIAHNRADHPYVFQISPGEGPGAMRVALQAHLANEAWNRLTDELNAAPERRERGASERSADPAVVPPVAEHPHLWGEVRLHFEARSSLYNTDGQVFSDVGVPAVLFMEDYDISRQGYHDTHDTMENIDLDYGAGVSAIAIETIARLATEKGRAE
ncbi:MAG: Zn-dependent exopeptidase M28 [Acidobacteriia bacterium]|nr:Zn-dependent exopeptidase M28 [Terriglobia bacterium]